MAVQMHEIYAEFKRAGFSRKEALELVAKMMTSTVTATIEENKKEED
jgi:pyrroline-5-carboxylate reductase